MSFLAPERLALLAAVIALAGWYVALLARRRRYAVRFTNLDLLDAVAPKRPGWRRHVPAGLLGLAAAAIVIALAQPTVERTVATESATVVLAVDTSISMDATDVDPSRMQAAIDEAVGFVDGLPDGVEVGLVAFDGTARVLSGPTDDLDTIVAAITALTTDRGTAGGDAIEVALESIAATLAEPMGVRAATDPVPTEESDRPPATIVLLSDGATTSGMPIAEAARLAADAGVPVSTITYGTAGGTVDVDGQTVPVPPDTGSMAAVADLTGGTAFTASDAEQLASVYEELRSRIATTVEEQPLTVEFAAVGFVLLLVAAGTAFVWTGRFL